MTQLAAIVFFVIAGLAGVTLLGLIIAALSMAVINNWLDLKDHLQERRRRRQAQ